MAVSADQVATMRAYLSGDGDEFARLSQGLYRSKESARAYAALITGAFFEAVGRRFSEQTTRSEIIDYVADVRSRSDNVAEKLDPDKAERMIMMVIGDADISDLSANERIGVQMLLIAGLVADEDFDEAEREAFLEKARAFGDGILG